MAVLTCYKNMTIMKNVERNVTFVTTLSSIACVQNYFFTFSINYIFII